jgi:glycosyltransferase involved in cell wall biosynthesis
VLKEPSDRAATRWCYTRARYVVGVSDAVVRTMRAFDDRCVLRTIYDCVPELPQPEPTAVRALREEFAGKILVGQVGQLDDAAKGQRLTIEAARRLEHIRPNLTFLLVGEGSDEAALRAEADALSNVHFVGWTDHITNCYAALDILVFPSRTEALGSSILEAMSFGVPVIAAAVGGIPEIVEHETNGLLFAEGSVEHLCRHLIRVADDEPIRRRMAQQARRTASRLSARSMAAQYQSLYEEVIAPAGNGAPERTESHSMPR